MKRILAIACCCAAVLALGQDNPAPQKVFRYAWLIAETSFDPEKVQDVYSGIANSAMFDTSAHFSQTTTKSIAYCFHSYGKVYPVKRRPYISSIQRRARNIWSG